MCRQLKIMFRGSKLVFILPKRLHFVNSISWLTILWKVFRSIRLVELEKLLGISNYSHLLWKWNFWSTVHHCDIIERLTFCVACSSKFSLLIWWRVAAHFYNVQKEGRYVQYTSSNIWLADSLKHFICVNKIKFHTISLC